MKLTKEATTSPGQIWLLGLLLVTAAALRIYAARNDLWLDEIWSLKLAGTVSSPWQVFTKIHHDNNNYLNTLWLYWCGFHGNWPGYRIPSIAAGIGSVLLAGMISRRRSAVAACLAMLLVAFSYVQILYSSEARGYAEVVFFSFLSFYALEKYLEKREWRFALLFSISAIPGFASHLIFLNFFGAAILWSGWLISKSGLGSGRAFQAMLACHAAPTLFLMTLYFVDIRHQVFGGGTENGPGIYADSFAWALGALPGHFGMVITVFFAAALLLTGLWMLLREKSYSLIFYASVILVVPILLAVVRHSEVLYVRHFMIGMAFFLILLSFVLAAFYERGGAGRILCVLLMAGYFTLNGWLTMGLFKYGRGHYDEAARYLVEHTKGPVVTVGGDHDFRIGFVLQFYLTSIADDKTANYYGNSRANSWPRGEPEWYIAHKESFADPSPPGRQIAIGASNTYEFIKAFPAAPLSGLHWFIYHNQAVSQPN